MIYGSWCLGLFLGFLRSLSLADAARRLVRGGNALSMNKHEHTGLGDRACVCVHGDATFCTSSCPHHTPSPWCMTGKADRSDIENIALYPCSRPKKKPPAESAGVVRTRHLPPTQPTASTGSERKCTRSFFPPFIMQESPSDTADCSAQSKARRWRYQDK